MRWPALQEAERARELALSSLHPPTEHPQQAPVSPIKGLAQTQANKKRRQSDGLVRISGKMFSPDADPGPDCCPYPDPNPDPTPQARYSVGGTSKRMLMGTPSPSAPLNQSISEKSQPLKVSERMSVP